MNLKESRDKFKHSSQEVTLNLNHLAQYVETLKKLLDTDVEKRLQEEVSDTACPQLSLYHSVIEEAADYLPTLKYRHKQVCRPDREKTISRVGWEGWHKALSIYLCEGENLLETWANKYPAQWGTGLTRILIEPTEGQEEPASLCKLYLAWEELLKNLSPTEIT